MPKQERMPRQGSDCRHGTDLGSAGCAPPASGSLQVDHCGGTGESHRWSVINHHHLDVRMIQLLDGSQGIGFQRVLPVLGANHDRYEWRYVFDELDDLNDNKRSVNALPAGRCRPVGALTGAENVGRNSPAPCPAPQVWARLDDEWPSDGTREVLDR